MNESTSDRKAKPFLKWAGGKTQLLPTIDSFLPLDFSEQNSINYIEPFVGGGALLFFLLGKYPAIKQAVINDINIHLIKTYKTIKDSPVKLIDRLSVMEREYRKLHDEQDRKDFYLSIREKFNLSNLDDIDEATYMIFLNRTCFNGLYRENKSGKFNVPFGRYVNPTICDGSLIMADSELLQRVIIEHGDFSNVKKHIDGYTFLYFDPPYRPLSATSNFNTYVKEAFNDDEQKRLRDFVQQVSEMGCYTMLSNSDGKSSNGDDFFDRLYENFRIERVVAKRSINSNATKRGALTELLIMNYGKH